MAQGILEYNPDVDRCIVLDEQGNDLTYGGLSCGHPLKVMRGDGWFDTRIEYDDDYGWFLAGLLDVSLDGLKVRLS